MGFNINNRRYTGCKQKLLSWIKSEIVSKCGKSESFCDLFAGTGVVAAEMLSTFNTIYVNDFLYSNEIIYKAFMLKMNYSKEKINVYFDRYVRLSPNNIEQNYVSVNYGGKFFSMDDALIIGAIREDIENNKNELNEKEYSILLASLLYSLDRSANTCGHYDSFIKKEIVRSSFKFELVNPLIDSVDDSHNIIISRQDSNELVKSLKCDVVYIDPPYSSRQYSRFYHVLENITKWNKPKLYGEALKPKEENMSEYCRSGAKERFTDLIKNIDAKYIIVSYNNTYNSKSSSSKNKMLLEDIKDILTNKGKTDILYKDFKAFNAGKTDIKDHKEILFITKVGE